MLKAKELLARYPKPRSAMLPLLFLVQAEEGYVSPAGVAEVAALLGVTKAEVGAVATFYTMYNRRPAGKYVVSVCRTLSCQVRGANEVTDALLARCGTELGQTTADGMVTVEEVECLAACDGAPVVQVNYENYERLTPEQAGDLAGKLLAGEVPPPTFADQGSVTEPSSAGAYWRLAGLGEPPNRLLGLPDPEPEEAATAFPPQPVAPGGREDPTDRSVQEMRTGVDHGGSQPEAPEAGTDTEQEPQAEAAPAKAKRQRRKGAAPSVEDAPARTEAQAPEPERDTAEPTGGTPAGTDAEAGPHQRETPGGDPQ
jgi:NADH-quinone oxidoreductase subunit E